jgi:hypothetical protein
VVVSALKKRLAEKINTGRSTPGTPRKNDPIRGKKQPQVDGISEDLN